MNARFKRVSSLGGGVFVCERHSATASGDLERQGGKRGGGTASPLSSRQVQSGGTPVEYEAGMEKSWKWTAVKAA